MKTPFLEICHVQKPVPNTIEVDNYIYNIYILYIYTENIYNKELSHAIMEANKPQDLQSIS